MTQAKQQEKIQEIMGLIRSMSDADFNAGECTGRADFAGAAKHEGDSSVIERAIESKLRELVREPLSDAEIKKHIGVERGSPSFVVLEAVVRATERAHNITNTIWVE